MAPSDKITQRLSRRRALGSLGALMAPPWLNGGMRQPARAQEATPTAAEALQAARGTVQFVHPEKVYFYLPGFEDEALRAALYELDVDTYRAIRADFAAAARGGAAELLADGAFAARVDRLPFRADAPVFVIGESDTDDLQSWFEILRHLLELRRPQEAIPFVNAGVSGQTTTQAFDQLSLAEAQPPDWIFCLLGGNDATRSGPHPAKTLVSIEETEKNLTELRRLATEGTAATWVWMTRPPIDEARVAAYPVFQQVPVVWRNADIEPINAFIARQPDMVVDVHAAFGDPLSSELLGPDGLHASLAGHKAIAAAVVERLTA